MKLKRPTEQRISLRGQIFFLIIGTYPLFMLVQFWLRSGTGLNSTVWGFLALYAVSFFVALNYFLFYRTHKPRSALVPPGLSKAILVATLLIPLGIFNMLAVSSGLELTLSPGPRIEASRMVPTIARVLLQKPVPVPAHKVLDLRHERWLLGGAYFKGSLWGALGYALAFGLAGGLFGLLREEKRDPRDEHIGTGLTGALVRGLVGLYYGSSMGFAMGALLIFFMRLMFPDFGSVQPSLLHWVYVFGAASNPNVAFTYAFSTACLLAGAMGLFLGRRDFTSTVSDPKAPELTRPVALVIPSVPQGPGMPFDRARMHAESQSILTQFGTELKRLAAGPEWQFERYELPVIPVLGQKTEPAPTNFISARQPMDEDDNAMGSLSNVYVQIVADLGTLHISAADWLTLAEGAMLELAKPQDDTLNVRINGKPAGTARALTANGYKAVKVIQLNARPEQLLGPRN